MKKINISISSSKGEIPTSPNTDSRLRMVEDLGVSVVDNLLELDACLNAVKADMVSYPSLSPEMLSEGLRKYVEHGMIGSIQDYLYTEYLNSAINGG